MSGDTLEAKVKISYPDEATALAALESVEPDNLEAPEGIKIHAERIKNELLITVATSRGVGTFASTLDDLLSCLSAAEKALKSLT